MRVMSSRSFSSRAAAMERTWASQRGMNTFSSALTRRTVLRI